MHIYFKSKLAHIQPGAGFPISVVIHQESLMGAYQPVQISRRGAAPTEILNQPSNGWSIAYHRDSNENNPHQLNYHGFAVRWERPCSCHHVCIVP